MLYLQQLFLLAQHHIKVLECNLHHQLLLLNQPFILLLFKQAQLFMVYILPPHYHLQSYHQSHQINLFFIFSFNVLLFPTLYLLQTFLLPLLIISLRLLFMQHQGITNYLQQEHNHHHLNYFHHHQISFFFNVLETDF